MSEYLALKTLQKEYGYKVLEALWTHHLAKIQEARDKAAKRGSETAWRYWAGQESGFMIAITAVQAALLEMERNAEEEQRENNPPDLNEDIPGDNNR